MTVIADHVNTRSEFFVLPSTDLLQKGPRRRDRPRLLTAGEVAERLGVAERPVAKLARFERLPCVRVGRLLRFSWVEVEGRLQEQGASSRERENDHRD